MVMARAADLVSVVSAGRVNFLDGLRGSTVLRLVTKATTPIPGGSRAQRRSTRATDRRI